MECGHLRDSSPLVPTADEDQRQTERPTEQKNDGVTQEVGRRRADEGAFPPYRHFAVLRDARLERDGSI